ncbi:aminopeptidase [Vallitalea pronyensis]|uniref:Aminopeptidase n=1 Tax=Vallitalea pronyensis TaxID=1348613 RepID=A0A8J8SIA7_9FIRM|nr:aminopeptidase [Vallitalea pronyensis]QUI24401.1 aminopeptidase [Vallitalea pronyensis]
MFNYKEYYKKENEPILHDYQKALKQVETMVMETKGKEDYEDYFNQLGQFILMVTELEEAMCEPNYYTKRSFEELQGINKALYEDILPEHYDTSYGNPAFAVAQFGRDMGQVLTALYGFVRDLIPNAYEHKLFAMAQTIELVNACYEHVKNRDTMEVETLRQLIAESKKSHIGLQAYDYLNYVSNPNITYLVDMINKDDLSDMRYLFKYGRYITDNEIKIATYVDTLPEETIKMMANIMSEGLRNGYIRDNKDITIKSTVSLRYQIGFERVMKHVIANFEALGLRSIINAIKLSNIEFNSVFTSMFSTLPNRQYYYDHRYDFAIYYDKAYSDIKLQALRDGAERLADQLKQYGGPALLQPFGENPFSPLSKKENIELDDEQIQLDKSVSIEKTKIIYTYVPREEFSFTIVSYPIPEIGEQFEAIFDETIKVNTLDQEVYDRIQHHIIDALDKGDYVHVKGKGTNKTDIKVNLYPLNAPEKETRFHNCLADVNIPVGEVYTSPVLAGTNGRLFVEEVFLNGLKYINLDMTFKDGFIETYTCDNFDDEAACKKYVHENLILPHDTLPIGEFAIGTNTTAYVMAQKYNIIHLLPILIVEKMGPHFAIGDTCFMWSEDIPVYNSNGKEVIARDNEKSILRKTNVEEAYTGRHTDITLPYSGLAFIDIIQADGERIPLIKDGKFVLKGTEELNKAFDVK